MKKSRTQHSLINNLMLFVVVVWSCAYQARAEGQTHTPPSFSANAGFYQTGLSLTLTSKQEDAIIYYTLDGAPPSTASQVYTAPLAIDTTTVVRAISVELGRRPSPVRTQTFFIGTESSLATVSLSTAPAHLWDPKRGIYVLGDSYEEKYPHAGANVWQDWERPVHVEFFEESGERSFDIDAGMKIQGTSSKLYDQKSLAVFFRSAYGVGKLKYSLFPTSSVREFESFVLRSSGSDWNITLLRDALMTQLVEDTGIDVQNYRPCIVYLNGVYWGIHNIREKVNEHFIASHHPVSPKSIDLLESDSEVIQGDCAHYKSLMRFVGSVNMASDAAFVRVDRAIEIDNFIDYYVAQMYFGNVDWPAKNIKFWRDGDARGKWRWILFDTDFGFAKLVEVDHDMLAYVLDPAQAEGQNPQQTRSRNPLWSTLLVRRLMGNERFEKRFIRRFINHLNTTFRPQRVLEQIESMQAVIAPEIPRHFARWSKARVVPYMPPHLPQGPNLVKRWQDNVQVLRDFATQRSDIVRAQLRSHFSLRDAPIALRVVPAEAGVIRIDGRLAAGALWRGDYFAGLEVRLDAVGRAGYEFDHWIGVDAQSSTNVSIEVEGDMDITAVFRRTRDGMGPVVINEINYHAPDERDSGDWIELYNNSATAIDMSGWVFADSDDDHSFIFPRGTIIAPNGFAVICQDVKDFARAFPDVEDPLGNFGFGLSRKGEALRLIDDRGAIVDSLSYAAAPSWPVESAGERSSLVLIDPGVDNALAAHWEAVGQSTPGAVNRRAVSTVVDERQVAPAELFLAPNFPNPFNAATSIRFGVPIDGIVRVAVYNLAGQLVQVLVSGFREAGEHLVEFDGGDLASGVYFYRLEVNGLAVAQDMLLAK